MTLNVVRNYFKSGAIESEYTEVAGKIEGCRQHWYENGQIFAEAEFKDGVPHGIVREWSENGVLLLLASRSEGEFNGLYQSWWDDGKPKENGEFLNGVRQSGFTWFREDGSVWKRL